MRRLIIAAAAAVAMSVSAYAADPPTRSRSYIPDPTAPQKVDTPSWTGFTATAFGGVNGADGKLSFGGTSLDNLGATGFAGGGELGARLQVPSTALVLGARAGYQWYQGEFEIATGGGSFKAGLKDAWYVDGTMGLAIGSALPYVLAGYTKAHTQASITGGPSIAAPDLEGYRLGGGIEMRLPSTLAGWLTPTLGVQYVYTDYKDVTLGGPGGPVLDVRDHEVMTRLTFQLGK